MKILFLQLLLSLFIFPVYGEIEWIKIKWNSPLCPDSCIQNLHKQFEQIKGVSEISIDQSAGQAVLKWKVNQPYAFQPINIAMRMVGLTILDYRIRVKGRIFIDGKTFKLLSIGDDTTFVLLGPINNMNLNQQSIEFSAQNRQITGDLKEKLLAAKKANAAVTIEGVLFEPQRQPLIQLVIEQLNIEEQKQGKPSKKYPKKIFSP